MTCKSICLKTTKKQNLEDISNSIYKNIDAYKTLKEYRQFQDIQILNLLLEKRYRRINDYVCLTVQFLEQKNEQFVQIIGYTDNVMFDFGSIDHFMVQLISILKELGFEEV